jgi:hypothetical protein
MSEEITDLAKRFNGLSIDFRRTETNWPKPWRLKVYSCKDSNDQYRIEEYFESLDDLITRATHLNNT